MKRLIYSAVVLCCVLGRPSHAEDETLPGIDTVLKRVRMMANQEQGNDRLFRSRYAFVQTTATRELDSKGRIKKNDRTETRNNPRTDSMIIRRRR